MQDFFAPRCKEEDRGWRGSAVACSGLEEERAKLEGKRLRVYCARASERFFALSQKSVNVKVDFLFFSFLLTLIGEKTHKALMI